MLYERPVFCGTPQSTATPYIRHYVEILCGWLSKLWSLFGVPIILRHLLFRVPKKGP